MILMSSCAVTGEGVCVRRGYVGGELVAMELAVKTVVVAVRFADLGRRHGQLCGGVERWFVLTTKGEVGQMQRCILHELD